MSQEKFHGRRRTHKIAEFQVLLQLRELLLGIRSTDLVARQFRHQCHRLDPGEQKAELLRFIFQSLQLLLQVRDRVFQTDHYFSVRSECQGVVSGCREHKVAGGGLFMSRRAAAKVLCHAKSRMGARPDKKVVLHVGGESLLPVGRKKCRTQTSLRGRCRVLSRHQPALAVLLAGEHQWQFS